MIRRQPVRAVMALVLTVACGQGPVSTTSPPPDPTTTTATSLPASQDVAVAFFEAWQAGDREVMKGLSEPTALAQADRLGGLAGASWEPELCEGAAGTVHCIWVSDAGTLAIGVQNLEVPHLVTSFELVDP